ncbi:MAG TPA: DUF423 domain-containing protein [Pirellulales bacterium]|nr:DUF423 domain-containing protein [Pirellulales bacterium]
MSPRMWIIVGAVFGALAVGTGAFGAHALKERLEETGKSETYEIAVRYQMYHALALVLVGLVGLQMPAPSLNVAGLCFTVGIVVFSGLLYPLALGGPKIFGAIVPIGGLSFIAGWLVLATAAFAKK